MSQDNSTVLELSKDSINIRMYEIENGSGDCFLLRFLDDNGDPFHILIDCGSFWQTKDQKTTFPVIVKDIADITNKHINVALITHEHYDHLSGFDFAKKEFSEIVFDELWLAWTENVAGDELAESLHDKYEKELNALAAVTEKFEAANDPWVEPIKHVLSLSANSDRILDEVQKNLSPNPPRFCDPKLPPITIPGVSNLRFYILGPTKNKGALIKLHAEKAVHGNAMMIDESTSFTAAVLSSFGEKKLTPKQRLKNQYLTKYCFPFDKKYGLAKKDTLTYNVDGELFFVNSYGPDDPEKDWRHIENDWLYSAGNLALQIDGYTNNTSLVVAIEMVDTGKVLLFTGDAESENWEFWKDHEWTVINSDGDYEKRDGDGLVYSTAFYKVSHHGSENGTVLEYLEKMRNDLVAMIPVNEKNALDEKGWEHPTPAVYTELKNKTKNRVIRADLRILEAKHPDLSLDEWNTFKSKVYGSKKTIEDLWIEYKFS